MLPILLSEVDALGDRHTILIRIPVDCHILRNGILHGCKVKVHGQSILKGLFFISRLMQPGHMWRYRVHYPEACAVTE